MALSNNDSRILRWSQVDKVKFFGIGTAMYSGITILLHPMTVLKIRQQVLNSSANKSKDALQHQMTLRHTFHDIMASSSGVRGLFRGVGTVVTLAIPARVVYISVLEASRQQCTTGLSHLFHKMYQDNDEHDKAMMVPLVAALSGGLAGGLAAMSAQILVVPMDVISQKQMVMAAERYSKEGAALSIIQAEIKSGGWRALYRGFGLSLFSSLPTGSVWWATYNACQHWIDDHLTLHYGDRDEAWIRTGQRGIVQLCSGLTAALVASALTQPLDVVKTRLQVGVSGTSLGVGAASLSPLTVATQLASSSGMRGFFRGLGPRTFHMGVWGTILSSAYELLRHISRKEA